MDVKNKVRAALITREDNPNLTKWRMRRLIQGRNLSEDDLGDRLYVNSRDQSPVFKLDVPEQLSEMMVALKQFQPEVVILDVLNVLHSGEENDNTEMRKILDHAQLMSEETKAGVCVLHHFNKDQKNGRLTQRIRGASAIAGWAEYVIGIHRQSEESEDSLRWAEFELKASSSPTKIHFRIQSDELAPRTHIDCEEAPMKSQRKSRGGNIP
jgi:RecA-family ATPase